MLHTVQTLSLHATFWTALAFCAGVSVFWPWWKTDLGWTIVLKTLCLAIILLPYELRTLFHVDNGATGFQWMATIAFAAIPLIIAWRFAVILAIQRYDPPPTASAWGARGRWKARKH